MNEAQTITAMITAAAAVLSMLGTLVSVLLQLRMRVMLADFRESLRGQYYDREMIDHKLKALVEKLPCFRAAEFEAERCSERER